MQGSKAKALFELVQSTIVGKVDLDHFYDQLQAHGSVEDISPAVVESFWLLWNKLDHPSGSEKRMRLVEVIKNSIRDKKVDRKVAMEVLDGECMQAAGLVTDIELWKRKEIRFNTRTLYTVNKYNLLREDSEGYAKLVVALNHFCDAALKEELVEPLYKEIQALIGYFDLDPNRVLDLVLDAAEAQPENRAFLRLVPLFKREAIVHLLGFKFQHCQKPQPVPVWPNLPRLAASLVADGLVDLDDLLGHLTPSDDAMRKAQEGALEQLKADVDAIGTRNLNAPASQATASAPGALAAAPSAAGLPGAGGLAPMGQPPGGAPPVVAGSGGVIASIRAHHPQYGGPSIDPRAMDPRMGGMGGGMGGYGGSMGGMGGGMGGMGGGGGGRGGGRGMGAGMGGGMASMGGGMASMGGGLDMMGRGGPAAMGLMPGMPVLGLQAGQLDLDPTRLFEQMLAKAGAACNQKLALAQMLVEVGAWDHASALMSRVAASGLQPASWPPLCDTLCCVVAHEMESVLAVLAPQGLQRPGLLEVAKAVQERGTSAADSTETLTQAVKQAGLTPGPPLEPHAMEVLLALGPFLSRRPKLLMQVIRVMRHHLMFYGQPPSPSEDPHTGPVDSTDAAGVARAEALRVEEVLARVLLPSVALICSSPAVDLELWELLRLLPFTTRYRLYAEQRELTERSPYLAAASRMAVYETRKVLKRLHSVPDKRERKDACRPHGRLLAKIAAGNPLQVLETMVQQVEAYANQMEPILDALKYLTPYGFDALTYTILTRLTLDRAKVKEDGINISDWLQSLARFTGAVCRKYPEVDIAALCQFLANALRSADSFDLLVLKELVETLTGISITSDMSDEQLEGTLGGDALQSLVLMRDTDKSKKTWARGARRLLDALQRGPPCQHLALPLLLLIAQQRQIIMVQTQAQHIKFVVELYDKCHETTQQYITFLQAALSRGDYCNLLPSMEDMRIKFKLDPEIVFMAYRPILRSLLEDFQASIQGAEEGEIEEAPAAAPQPQKDGKQASAADPPPAVHAEAAATKSEGAGAMEVDDGQEMTWLKATKIMQLSMPDQTMWDRLTPEMYGLFWTLTVHDIYVPTKTYEREMDKAKSELRAVETRLTMARSTGPSAMSDEELMDSMRQRDRLRDLLKRMPAELEAQQKRVEEVVRQLDRDKDRLLQSVSNKKEIPVILAQECVMPRMLTSPQDAAFCARIGPLLHSLDVPYFSTVWYYNRLLMDIVPLIRCITDREAINMGIFLYETLRLLNYWRSSEKVYMDECHVHSGFSINLESCAGTKRTSYDQFKGLMGKWHRMIMGNFKACLDSSEYTSRRNALSVLKRLIPVFPVVEGHMRVLRSTLEKVLADEQREDLKIMLRSYTIAFNTEMDKPGRVISEREFGVIVKPKPKPDAQPAPSNGNASQSTDAKPTDAAKAPAPARPPSKLRPDVQEFVPSSAAATAHSAAARKGSAEGGEPPGPSAAHAADAGADAAAAHQDGDTRHKAKRVKVETPQGPAPAKSAMEPPSSGARPPKRESEAAGHMAAPSASKRPRTEPSAAHLPAAGSMTPPVGVDQPPVGANERGEASFGVQQLQHPTGGRDTEPGRDRRKGDKGGDRSAGATPAATTSSDKQEGNKREGSSRDRGGRRSSREPKEERRDREAEMAEQLSHIQQQHAAGGRATKGERGDASEQAEAAGGGGPSGTGLAPVQPSGSKRKHKDKDKDKDKEHKSERSERGGSASHGHQALTPAAGRDNGAEAANRAQLMQRRQQMQEPLPPLGHQQGHGGTDGGRMSRRNSSASRR